MHITCKVTPDCTLNNGWIDPVELLLHHSQANCSILIPLKKNIDNKTMYKMWLVTLLSFQYVSCAKIAQTNAGLCHVTVEIYETQKPERPAHCNTETYCPQNFGKMQYF